MRESDLSVFPNQKSSSFAQSAVALWQAVENGVSVRRKKKSAPKRIPIREGLTFTQQRRNRAFLSKLTPEGRGSLRTPAFTER